MEPGAGQPHAPWQRWSKQAESAAAPTAKRWCWGRRPAATATAAAAQRRRHERVAGRSGAALDRPGRVAHAPRSRRPHAPRGAGGSEGLVMLLVLTALL